MAITGKPSKIREIKARGQIPMKNLINLAVALKLNQFTWWKLICFIYIMFHIFSSIRLPFLVYINIMYLGWVPDIVRNKHQTDKSVKNELHRYSDLVDARETFITHLTTESLTGHNSLVIAWVVNFFLYQVFLKKRKIGSIQVVVWVVR
jgi:hypothetical protein